MVFSVYDNPFEGSLNNNYGTKAVHDGVQASDLETVADPTFANINKLGMEMSDAVVVGSPEIDPSLQEYIDGLSKPVLGYHDEDTYVDAYSKFYDEVLEENSVMAD